VKQFVAAALLSVAALPALADEVWTTPLGDVIYESDLKNGMAIFSAPAAIIMGDAPADARVWIYIPDFAYAIDNRYFHEAFWIVEGMDYCPMGMSGPDGRESRAWGRAQLAFDVPTFPSSFSMNMGFCSYDPYFPVRAEAKVG
jgi:hypothetical protein